MRRVWHEAAQGADQSPRTTMIQALMDVTIYLGTIITIIIIISIIIIMFTSSHEHTARLRSRWMMLRERFMS
jgi:hypothetical protein